MSSIDLAFFNISIKRFSTSRFVFSLASRSTNSSVTSFASIFFDLTIVADAIILSVKDSKLSLETLITRLLLIEKS